MIVLIPVGAPPGVRAEMIEGRWTCSNRSVLAILRGRAGVDSLRGYWPDQGAGIMALVEAAFPGATLVKADPVASVVPGRIY